MGFIGKQLTPEGQPLCSLKLYASITDTGCAADDNAKINNRHVR